MASKTAGPSMQIDGIDIQQKLDLLGKPMENRWVLPGCQVVTTTEAQLLAQRRGLAFSYTHSTKEI